MNEGNKFVFVVDDEHVSSLIGRCRNVDFGSDEQCCFAFSLVNEEVCASSKVERCRWSSSYPGKTNV